VQNHIDFKTGKTRDFAVSFSKQPETWLLKFCAELETLLAVGMSKTTAHLFTNCEIV